jgi:hypothetical protein
MKPPSRPVAVRRPVSTASAPGRFRRAVQTLLPAQAERPVSIPILPAATLFPWSSPPCARGPVLPGAGRAGHIPQSGRARGCQGASQPGRMLPRLRAGCGIQVPRRPGTAGVLIGPYGSPFSLPLNSNFRNERPGGIPCGPEAARASFYHRHRWLKPSDLHAGARPSGESRHGQQSPNDRHTTTTRKEPRSACPRRCSSQA